MFAGYSIIPYLLQSAQSKRRHTCNQASTVWVHVSHPQTSKELNPTPTTPTTPTRNARFTSGNPNAALPAPATTHGGMESAQAAAQAAVAALGVRMPRATTTLRLNNMLTAADLADESSFGDIEEETKVGCFIMIEWYFFAFVRRGGYFVWDTHTQNST